jgi:methyl-accepting chemotaxis protein
VNQRKESSRQKRQGAAVPSEGAADASAITEVLRALRKARTSREALDAALLAVRAAFGWTYGSYWQVDEAEGALRFVTDAGTVSPAFRELTLTSTFGRGIGVNGRTWESGELLVIEDLGDVQDCARAPLAREAGIRSGVCLPITMDGRVIGTMDFFSAEKQALGEARKQALRNVGELVSSTLERVRDGELQREQAENARAITRVVEALSHADSLDDMVLFALNEVRASFGWSYGSFWMLDGEHGVLRFRSESGTVNEAFRRITREATFQRGRGVNGRAWLERDLILVEDLGRVMDCVRAPIAQQAGIRSGVCFPIAANGEVIGTMDFFSTDPMTHSAARTDALRSVARLVSSAAGRIADRSEFTKALKEFSAMLDGAAKDLTGTIAEQSAAAQELATSVSEVSATLSELRQTSAEALSQAQKVIEKASRSADSSSEGARAVERTVLSMRDIREQVSMIAEHILTLSDQTSQVGNIIASVTEIAAQSKLLALNAAIEAARAGQHGRGFGVVASEIGNLAEQSREATSQVRRILGEIQGGTNSAVVSTEAGTKKVEIGMGLAEVSGENIRRLSEAIVEAAESARLIANSARQQNAGVQEVADALVAISNATNGAAAGLRQTEAATHELVRLNARMQDLIGRFGSGLRQDERRAAE